MGGNAYTIDKHPKKKAIVRDILRGVPVNAIATNYGLPESCVKRYKSGKLMKLCAEVIAEDKTDAQHLLDRVEPIIAKVQKMYDSYDEWLQDPEHADRYFVGPRASEVMVAIESVLEDDNGKKKTYREKRLLSDLIDQIEDRGYTVTGLQWNVQDPRKLFLATADTLTKQLDFLAKLQGLVKETVVVKNEPNRVMDSVAQVLFETIDDPELLKKVVDAIKDLKDPEENLEL